MTNPSARSSALMPSPRNPATSVAIRSLSLTRSSPRAANRHLTAMRGERRDRRQLVDQPWYFLGRDVERAGAVAFNRDAPARLAGGGLQDLDLDARAEAPQHAEQRRPRRIQADILDVDA